MQKILATYGRGESVITITRKVTQNPEQAQEQIKNVEIQTNRRHNIIRFTILQNTTRVIQNVTRENDNKHTRHRYL